MVSTVNLFGEAPWRPQQSTTRRPATSFILGPASPPLSRRAYTWLENLSHEDPSLAAGLRPAEFISSVRSHGAGRYNTLHISLLVAAGSVFSFFRVAGLAKALSFITYTHQNGRAGQS